jgi:hypothetical protein
MVAPVQVVNGVKKRLEAVKILKDKGVEISPEMVEQIAKKRQSLQVQDIQRFLPQKRREWFERNRKRHQEFEERVRTIREQKVQVEGDGVTSKLKTLRMLMEAAKELECTSVESCKSVCEKPENQRKCMEFARRFDLEIPAEVKSEVEKLDPDDCRSEDCEEFFRRE